MLQQLMNELALKARVGKDRGEMVRRGPQDVRSEDQGCFVNRVPRMIQNSPRLCGVIFVVAITLSWRNICAKLITNSSTRRCNAGRQVTNLIVSAGDFDADNAAL